MFIMKKFFNFPKSFAENFTRKKVLSLIFFAVFFLLFAVIERLYKPQYHIVTTKLDYMIPLIKPFVLFYFSWFIYAYGILILLFFINEEAYLRCALFYACGMIVFLLINLVYPTAVDLRPLYLSDGFFDRLLKLLYTADTPTNVFPSLHVYQSVGMHFTLLFITRSKTKKNALIRGASFLFCVMITLSTMFIKQHSIADVAGAFVLAFIVQLCLIKKEKGTS